MKASTHRWIRPLAAGLCLFATSPLVSASALAADQIGTLQEELALARKAGLPTTPADMKTTPPPPERNAATYYQQFDLWMRAHPYQRTDPQEGSLLGRLRPDAAIQASGRKRLTSQKEALRLIHLAAAQMRADYQKNWALGAAILFPEYARMRGASRLLLDESAVLLWDGKPVEAVNTMALGFQIARHADSGGTVIAHLVAVAVDAITLRGLENILYQAGESPGVAAAVRKAIEHSFVQPSLANALRGELVIELVSIDQIKKGGPQAFQQFLSDSSAQGAQPAPPPKRPTADELAKYARLIDGNAAAMTHYIQRAYLAADSPFPAADKAFRDIAKSIKRAGSRYVLVENLVPVNGKLPATRARPISKAAVIRSAAAALEWKARHGTFPEHLSQAVTEPPLDPFDLKPLRYRRLGKVFIVWSVGETGKFGGINASPKDYRLQAVFRWPMPQVLKQPATPSATPSAAGAR